MLWAERADRLFITIEVADAKDPKVDISDAGVLTLNTLAGSEGARYALNLELLHPVDSKARRAVRVQRGTAPHVTGAERPLRGRHRRRRLP